VRKLACNFDGGAGLGLGGRGVAAAVLAFPVGLAWFAGHVQLFVF